MRKPWQRDCPWTLVFRRDALAIPMEIVEEILRFAMIAIAVLLNRDAIVVERVIVLVVLLSVMTVPVVLSPLGVDAIPQLIAVL